ncbi:MAG: mismatch repair protein MutS [Candidatus Dependentiae bacterium]|nr:mismatch repair protein MutS [Candidatus Dependentiae bacterium]
MKHIVFKTLCGALLVSVCVNASAPYNLLRDEILNNFPAVRANNDVKKEKKGVSFPAAALTPYEKHQALFRILGAGVAPSDAIIDAKTISDLNLFFYNVERPDYTILETTYRGSSLNGKIAQGKLIVSPTDDIESLLMRQKAVKYLMENTAVATKLRTLFDQLTALETKIYSLWNDNDVLYSPFVQDTFYKGKFERYQGQSGAAFLEFNRRLNDVRPLYDYAQLEVIGFIAWNIALPKLGQYISGQKKPLEFDFTPMSVYAARGLKSLSSDLSSGKLQMTLPLAAILLSAGIFVGSKLMNLPTWWRTVQTHKSFIAYVRKRFAALAEWYAIVEDIHATIQGEYELCMAMGNAHVLGHFTDGKDAELASFFETLSSSTFTSSSYYLANAGAVLYAIPQFLKIRHKLGSIFEVIGSLEAYLSIGAFLAEKQNSPAPWCFASYAQSATPYFNFVDYSHPLIPAEKSVLNTLELGNNSQQGMIVTGPNASGKSMNVRSIVLCLLLGQSLGIAPTRNALFTPMSKILTYLNPVDNIAEGRSLFQAEEDRINYIVQAAATLPADKFSFIAADELLSSTAPTEGEAAAFGIGYGLSKYPNCMPIMATHFAKLTVLPEDTNGFYINYHVSVVRMANGDIKHTFLLEPGRAHQVIAIDLARKEGFDPEILDYADQFLLNQGIERGRTLV